MAQISKTTWEAKLASLINDNSNRDITPEDVRTIFGDLSDSIKWRSDVLFVSPTNGDYAQIQAAHDALPSTGGTILVDALNSGDSDYENFTITTDNVKIIGLAPASINYSTGVLNDYGVRIEGTCLIQGNFCEVRNISIHTINTAADCMRWGGVHTNGLLENCQFLGQANNSPWHCLLLEGYSNVQVNNIKTYRNIWGVALKDSNLTLTDHYAVDHNNGPVIAKGDGGSTIRQINVENVTYQGNGFGNFYVQSVSSSTLEDVNFTNCLAYEGGFLYTLEAGSTIARTVFKGCISNNATNYGFNFFGTSSSAITLIGCAAVGAGSGSVQMDDATGFTNIVYSGCDFDGDIEGVAYSSRRSTGISITKTGVAENTATNVVDLVYEDIDAGAYLVTVLSNSTSTIASEVFLVTHAFSAISATSLASDFSGVTSVTLTPTVTTGTNTVRLSVTINQTSLTETMRVEMQITPIGGKREFTVTPL